MLQNYNTVPPWRWTVTSLVEMRVFLAIKVQFQLLLLMFPLQWVCMISHLNNQCLFISQSYFSHFSHQPKRLLQTMSWMKYKLTAVLLMRPNTTLLRAIFRFHLNSSLWWLFLNHRHSQWSTGPWENISYRWTSKITYQHRPPFHSAIVKYQSLH